MNTKGHGKQIIRIIIYKHTQSKKHQHIWYKKDFCTTNFPLNANQGRNKILLVNYHFHQLQFKDKTCANQPY